MKKHLSTLLLIVVPILVLLVWISATSNNKLEPLPHSALLADDWLERLNHEDLEVTPDIIFGERSILGSITARECAESELPLSERSVHRIVEQNFESLKQTSSWTLNCLQPQQVYERAMDQSLERYKTLYQVSKDSIQLADSKSHCCSAHQRINAQKILELWQSLICTSRETLGTPEDAFYAEMYWRVQDDNLVAATIDSRCAPK